MARRGVHVDSSEVNELAVEFRGASRRLKDDLGDVFRNEANALHRGMVNDARNHRYLPKFAKDLGKSKIGDYDYEIGFDKRVRLQGRLAHIIVFGSVNNAPVYDFHRQLAVRTPPFVSHLARIAEDAALRKRKP